MTANSPNARDAQAPEPLVEWMDAQYRLSAAAMLRSVGAVQLVKERPGFGQMIRPIRGSILASPEIAAYDPDPDYFFHWLRDSAIVIDALRTLVEDGACGTDAIDCVRDFIRFSLALGDLDGRAVSKSFDHRAVAPEFRQYLRPESELVKVLGDEILAEARFNPDGTLDIAKWARPQHDGPALRALVVLRFLRGRVFEDAATNLRARRLVDVDLRFTRQRWREPSFDIWVEEIGHHYYTRLVQRAPLSDGADWLQESGDATQALACREASREIADGLGDHWDEAKGFYLSRVGASPGGAKELDIAVILGVIHARRSDGPHSVHDPKAGKTLDRLERLFAQEYPINASRPPDRGVAMGRYQGDSYYSGGAYYFATLGAAEFYYRLAEGLANRRAPDTSVESDLTPDRPDPPETHVLRGDQFMATVRAYSPASGELSEQFDRVDGHQTSSKNLAWSHAALITAVAARRAAVRALKLERGEIGTRLSR